MSDFDVKEKRFEQDIEEYLTTYGGYQKGNAAALNREKALDTGTFLSFIRTSQPKQWERFEKSTAPTVSGSSSTVLPGSEAGWPLESTAPGLYRSGHQVPGRVLEAGDLHQRDQPGPICRQHPPLYPAAPLLPEQRKQH